MRIAPVVVIVGLLALAGCHRAPQDRPDSENGAVAAPEDLPPPDNAMLPPPIANAANTAVPKPAPPPKVSDETQMHDDADATGLTSRLPDDEPVAGSNAEETRPAEK